jgi:hypothetical protein
MSTSETYNQFHSHDFPIHFHGATCRGYCFDLIDVYSTVSALQGGQWREAPCPRLYFRNTSPRGLRFAQPTLRRSVKRWNVQLVAGTREMSNPDVNDRLDDKLVAKDKITVLLAEYNALRAQMLQRNTIVNQLFSVCGTISIAFITLLFAYAAIFGALFFILILTPFLVYIFRLNQSDMIVTALRIEEISVAINDLVGERLLRTTTQPGDSTLGYVPNFSYAVYPFHRLGKLMTRRWIAHTAMAVKYPVDQKNIIEEGTIIGAKRILTLWRLATIRLKKISSK